MEGVGVRVGQVSAMVEGFSEMKRVGDGYMLGMENGVNDSMREGFKLGLIEGSRIGMREGICEISTVGLMIGCNEDMRVGKREGLGEG